MSIVKKSDIPVGTKALILSKYYYGVLSKRLEGIEVERYYSILYFLQENNGCTQQHICNHLATDKTAMVKVIKYLAEAGYVSRKMNENDKREHRIALTKKGIYRTKEIVNCFNAIDKQIFSIINKKERETFLVVLEKLSGHLQGLPGNDLFFNYKKTKKSSR